MSKTQSKRTRKQNIVLILTIFLGICILIPGSGYTFYLYRMNHPLIVKHPQNPFVFNNGSMVETAEDWNARRSEIKEILSELEYGHMPGRPDALNVSLIYSEVLEGGGTIDVLNFTIIPFNTTVNLNINLSVWVLSPEGPGPFPAIVLIEGYNNQSMNSIYREILDRGYILVFFQRKMLDPDTKGTDIIGPCQGAYPSYDWGSLAVWAWGAMRVADYLVGESWVDAPAGFPNVDPEMLIISGHSRSGKTALIAGAYDERFVMTNPNGSGCGGAGSFLIQSAFSENIGIMTSKRTYKSWFQEDFNQFAWKEKNLPFDQHYLRVLIAPRLILSTDALGDFWSNPSGTQAMYEASQPVFDFLEVSDSNAIHFRKGGHDHAPEDFAVLLNFGDLMILEKNISDDFYMHPFDLDLTFDY